MCIVNTPEMFFIANHVDQTRYTSRVGSGLTKGR